jgi:glucose-6-phosphate 1-dehydrogenase
MVLRFGNVLYEPLWNSAQVDHVQITVAEDLGVGARGGYYDAAGALRDMVQNHMLQLLCLVAMEPPDSYDANAIRDEKLKVLKALKPIGTDQTEQVTVRGQYRAGAANGGAVPGYCEELGVERTPTETFVALKAEISNWRWAGVPFYLRTGKRLPSRVSEIVVAFKPIPHSIFPKDAGAVQANRLVLRLQPDEGVKQWIMIKDPGPGGMRIRHVPLDMSFAEAFQARNPDSYERLLLDVIRGNQTLFMRRDEVEAAWSWIDPIKAAWERSGTQPKPYTAGSWGPSAAIALIERDGRTWHEEYHEA